VAGAKWVEPSKFYLTLRFIGAVEDALAANITAVLSRVATLSFALTLAGVEPLRQAYSLGRR
jgi:2'-5' RNA ligase